jgi:hypothetical protein
MLTARGATTSLLPPSSGIDTGPVGSDAGEVTTGPAGKLCAPARDGAGGCAAYAGARLAC